MPLFGVDQEVSLPSEPSHKNFPLKLFLFSFSGGVNKTISCAEIMKRHYKLHQVTQLCYQKVEEIWEPMLEGLEQIVVKRQIPAIHIIVSLDEIDPKTSGYQFSAHKTSMAFKPQPRKEKPFNIDGKRNPRKGRKGEQSRNSNKKQKSDTNKTENQ